ncbi:hypothetical protein NZK35_17835 [Stieleria sp. ICT_E10.1]|uniref:hypothetical protein n=1 Tax=Stieleria sedimenti TaxID=2976331 RepID=UPI00217F2C9C|nr:hypothetical protein [Stieleria sedimenti]MCS7468517.1 hypothetical protein [Stieleria sedimenti]
MEKHVFEKVDPLVDTVADQIDELVDGDSLNEIKNKLADISRELLGLSVSLDISVQVFDSERENSLPLLQTGLATSDGAAPHQVWGDSSPQRYIVDGEMAIVPHDRCPGCWGPWDFKERNPACPECGIEMGEQVKLLLDSDRCPNCEAGTVTASDPKCSECGYSVDPSHVAWG